MEPKKDPKIQLIQRVLQSKQFKIEDLDNGIRVIFNAAGYNNCAVDIYVLRNNPQFVRARVCSKASSPAEEQSRLDVIYATLQTAMAGAALLGKFNLLGSRGNIQVYYAPLSVDKDNGIKTSSGELSAEAAFSQLERGDSKMLRQTLDKLKLPRSSIVRLAITRIFRESVDAQELKTLVAQEAQNIVKPDDRETLKKLYDENQLPSFISVIVHLLRNNL